MAGVTPSHAHAGHGSGAAQATGRVRAYGPATGAVPAGWARTDRSPHGRQHRDRPFAELAADEQLAVLEGISHTPFFQLVRSTTVTFMYSDREVWQVLGYEGESSDKGGYLHRGFDDLDWLPEPRIEELSA